MSLFDSLSGGYARPSDFFSVVLEGGEILKFRAPSRDELPEIKERSAEFARGYIAKPEFSGLKIPVEMRVRIFVICELLVSASKDDVELDPMPITEWARLAMTHFQLVDAIYAAIERQTSVTVLSADTHVIEEAKKNLESPRLNSKDSTPQQSICDDTPTNAKES